MTETNQGSRESLKDRLVSFTRDLILIPTDASRPQDIDMGLEFLKNHLQPLSHIKIKEYTSNHVKSLVAMPTGIERPKVLMCGHLDVVTHQKLESYRSRMEQGRLYGPGAGDMKGQLAIMFELFREIVSTHPEASLGLAITTDEERGGEHGMRYLFEEARLRCDFALVPDGGSMNEIVVEEKGFLHLELTTQGRSGHAARPWQAENALEILTSDLRRIQDYIQSVSQDENYWHPTCAMTMMSTPNRSVNRIPKEATVGMDIRFPPPYTSDILFKNITDCLSPQTCIKVKIADEPSCLSPDPEYMECMRAVTGVKASSSLSFGASDARFICRQKIPTMVSSPLVGNMHAENEWIDVESMVTFYGIYDQYLKRKLSLDA